MHQKLELIVSMIVVKMVECPTHFIMKQNILITQERYEEWILNMNTERK